MQVLPEPHSAATLARFRAPAHQGRIGGEGVLTGHAGSRAQGRAVALDLKVDEQRVLDARFRAYGCPATIAAADLVCELASGAELAAARALSVPDLEARLALAPARRGCILLVQDALADALKGAGGAPITS